MARPAAAARGLAALVVAAGVLGGCGEQPPGPLDGDCTVRLGLEGTSYRFTDRPVGQAGAGRPVRADVLGCDGAVVGSLAVRRVPPRGEPARLVVPAGENRGVYVPEPR